MAEDISKRNSQKFEEIEQFGLFESRLQIPKDKFTLAIFALLFFGLSLLAVGAGMFLWKGSGESEDIRIIESGQDSSGKIVVHVDGAIQKPGVYELGGEARVNDAIFSAGGLSSDADSSRVNLAAKVSDGQKIHIPSVNDPVSTASGGQVSGINDTGSLYGQSGFININSATEGELDKLPGVGPVTAGKIINGRPYSSVEELLSRKIVNTSTF